MMTNPEGTGNPLPPCPTCGSFSWQKGFQVKDYSVSGEWFELFRCSHCNLLMTFPQPQASEIGRYYASQDYISHSDTSKGLTNRLYHAARNFMMKKKYNWVTTASGKSEGHLLDVGAGTGYFAHYMKSSGWNVVALEPDESARHVAGEKLGLEILPLDALVTQPKNKFDVITLWHVLEHVHDVEGYIDHFHALLKPDGMLVIAVPNHTSTDATHYKSQWAAYDVPRHLWHFSPLSMEKLLSRHAFTLLQKTDMPLDAYYVSMLSEKYKGNHFTGLVTAFFLGLKSVRAGKKNKESASSIIYFSKKA